MIDMEPVIASLTIEINVTCPHCENYIDLLRKKDTAMFDMNEDSSLTAQVLDSRSEWSDFECEDVCCTNCDKEFNVKGLEW